MTQVLIKQSDLDAIGQAHAKLTEVLAGIQVEVPTVSAPPPETPAKPPAASPGFVLGSRSLNNLQGIDARLVQCVHRAIKLTLQDFTVFEGLRTIERQRQLLAQGASRTLQSKHLTGHAVDLVPWIQGKAVWDWDGCAKIAFAMDQAATEQGIANKITWGGAWDRKLSDYGGRLEDYMKEVHSYVNRTGKNFIDGPHFEILP